MIRVTIADDHQLFAEGLRDALDAMPDMRVVRVVPSGPALLESLESQPADVILLDLEMPGGGGLDVIQRLAPTPTVVVSMHVTPETITVATQRGASGVLTKSAPLSDLAAAVRAVSDGRKLPTEDAALQASLEPFRSPRLDPGAESLTERERELLAMLAGGVSSTEELADRLFISQKTVKNHLASIFQKLSVSDRTQAAIEAIRLGIGKAK